MPDPVDDRPRHGPRHVRDGYEPPPRTIHDVDLTRASIGPHPSGMGEVHRTGPDAAPEGLAVLDVEAELDGTAQVLEDAAGGGCPASHTFGETDTGSPVVLVCFEEDPGHPRPHRDKIHGMAWDDSPLTLPWPAHTASLIVRDLIEAGADLLPTVHDAVTEDHEARWAAAVEVAMMLPGVVPAETA